MYYLLLLLLPLSLLSHSFSVATYNVENLFDAQKSGFEYTDYTPSTKGWNSDKVEVKLNHIAEVICDMNADIVALEEVENSHILARLQMRLEEVGCHYGYGAITHTPQSAIQEALLSRFPIKKEWDLVVPKERHILAVTLEIDAFDLTLFINHWKSQAYHGLESRRVSSANVLQQAIAKLPQGSEYVILGDLNEPYDATLRLDKRHNDTHGVSALNDILKVNKSELEIVGAKRGEHYNLYYELPPSERWSHRFYGRASSLDHIILPQTLFNGKGIEYINDSFRVFKPSYLLKKDVPFRWHTTQKGGRGYSDHLPVMARFQTKPYIPSMKTYYPLEAKEGSIEEVLSKRALRQPLLLKSLLVLFKRGHSGVVISTKGGLPLVLFGNLKGLKEGYVYDIRLEVLRCYHGLLEGTAFSLLKERGRISREPYYAKTLSASLPIGSVVHQVEGFYKEGRIYFEGGSLPCYFKKKSLRPKKPVWLKIDYAQIGYYNQKQLVIFSKKDFHLKEQ